MLDNDIVERLWRSVKYEDVYLRVIGPQYSRAGRTPDFQFYNSEHRHQALNRQTPDAAYFLNPEAKKAA